MSFLKRSENKDKTSKVSNQIIPSSGDSNTSAVVEEVMQIINKKLHDIEPYILEQIEKTVELRVTERFQQEIYRLQKRIESLEQLQHNSQKKRREIENTESSLTNNISHNRTVEEESTLSDYLMHCDCIYNKGLHHNGWIYYVNNTGKGNQGCVYKVREDGTQNTQLTTYKINYNPYFEVKDEYLYFYSFENGRSRRKHIKI